MKNKRALIISLIVFVILIIIAIFLFFNDDNTIVETENEIDQILLDSLTDLSYEFLLYNNLEYISAEFLIENNIIDEEYSELSCYIVKIDKSTYEDCELSETLVKEPLLVMTSYLNDEIIKYTGVFNDEGALLIELYNVDKYSGFYSENGVLLTEESIINLENYETGLYKVYYENGYENFYLIKDNEDPVIDSEVSESFNSLSFFDDHDYTIYYFYLMNYVDVEELNYSYYQENSYSNLEQEGSYYVYAYAIDSAGNYSGIYYTGQMYFEEYGSASFAGGD